MNCVASFSLVTLVWFGTAAGQDIPKRESGDFNFDGHLDYRDPSQSPGNRCGWWDYHLYDISSREHRAVETAFCGETFDPVEKLVRTYLSGGMAGYVYTVRHFRWEGLKPIAVFVETQNYDGSRDLFIRTRIWNMDGLSGPSTESKLLTREEVAAEFASRQ